MLEQLKGSQSLAGTVERFFTLRRYDAMGVFLVLLWTLSPFGIQMTLRLLEVQDSHIISNIPIRYLNTSTNSVTGSIFESAAMGVGYDDAVLHAVMQSLMLSSEAVIRSPMDGWGNVKITQIDQRLSINHRATNGLTLIPTLLRIRSH